jgi:hypothetical protein
MKTTLLHRALCEGISDGKRVPRTLPILVETEVELREASLSHAPVAARGPGWSASGQDERMVEFRWHDGRFFRQSELAMGKDGKLVLDDRGRDFADLGEHVEDRDTRQIMRDAHSELFAPIDFWNPRHLDLAMVADFAAAAERVAENFLVLDGALFERCFEPALVVRWNPTPTGSAVCENGDVSSLRRFVDFTRPDWRGLVPLGQDDQFTPRIGRITRHQMHVRCFSGVEGERVREFMRWLRHRGDVAKVNASAITDLEVLEPSLLSPDHDLAEFGRRVKNMVAWTREAREAVARHSPWEYRKIRDTFELLVARADRVSSVIAALDRGEIEAWTVADAAAELEGELLESFASIKSGKKGLDLAAFLPPPFFGDVNSFPIDLDAPSLSGP